MPDLPSLAELYRRHPGLTPALSQAYAEAAAVCLSRHCTPPSNIVAWVGDTVDQLWFDWVPPTERTLRAWNNEIDATESAAYGVALGAIEAELGLVAVSRARSLTGADYYVAELPLVNALEDAYKLEVSGIDHGGHREMRSRLHAKLLQVTAYGSPARAYACVVGFKALTIFLRQV